MPLVAPTAVSTSAFLSSSGMPPNSAMISSSSDLGAARGGAIGRLGVVEQCADSNDSADFISTGNVVASRVDLRCDRNGHVGRGVGCLHVVVDDAAARGGPGCDDQHAD